MTAIDNARVHLEEGLSTAKARVEVEISHIVKGAKWYKKHLLHTLTGL